MKNEVKRPEATGGGFCVTEAVDDSRDAWPKDPPARQTEETCRVSATSRSAFEGGELGKGGQR